MRESQKSVLGESGLRQVRMEVAGSSQIECISGSLNELLRRLHDKCLVDVGNHTTTGNRRLDKGVELLITSDRELQVAGSYALNLQVFAGVTS